MVERIPTGIPGFDKLVEGGFPKGSASLIAGAPGTGKSIFCLQALYNAALQKKDCLFVSFEQSTAEIKSQMKQFGWETERAVPHFKLLATDYKDPTFFSQLLAEVSSRKLDLIAIDSLASVIIDPFEVFGRPDFGLMRVIKQGGQLPIDVEALTRLKVKKVFDTVKASGATTLLTAEMMREGKGFSRDAISDFLADAIIVLQHNPTTGATNRTLTLQKMRLTKIDDLIHPLQITENGIKLK